MLKVQLLKSEEQKYRPGGPNVAELSNMFFTTKHRWFPKYVFNSTCIDLITLTLLNVISGNTYIDLNDCNNAEG